MHTLLNNCVIISKKKIHKHYLICKCFLGAGPWWGGPRAKIPATVLEGYGWMHFHFPVEAFPIQILPKTSVLYHIKDL